MKKIYIDFIIVANMLQAKSRKEDITSWTYYCNDMEFITWIEELGQQIHENFSIIDKEFMKKYDYDVPYIQWLFGRMQSYVAKAAHKEEVFMPINIKNRKPLPNEYLWTKLEVVIDDLNELE